VRQNKISQHENCYISEALNIFAPNFADLFAQYCALMCCFVLYLLDICQIDGNANFKTNFTIEQKVDFIIKVTEQQVPPLL